MSLTGNVGRVCIVHDGPFLLNQRVALLVPVEATDRGFAYCFFRQPDIRKKLELASNGVAQQNLSPVVTSRLPYAMPSRELRSQFDTVTRPMFDEVLVLRRMETRLAASRDPLLPRLISGDLAVSVAERELEAVP